MLNVSNERKDGEYQILSSENAVSVVEINTEGEWLMEKDLIDTKENKWIDVLKEGNYKLQIKIDVSELITIRSDNGKDVVELSLYEEDLESILAVIEGEINTR